MPLIRSATEELEEIMSSSKAHKLSQRSVEHSTEEIKISEKKKKKPMNSNPFDVASAAIAATSESQRKRKMKTHDGDDGDHIYNKKEKKEKKKEEEEEEEEAPVKKGKSETANGFGHVLRSMDHPHPQEHQDDEHNNGEEDDITNKKKKKKKDAKEEEEKGEVKAIDGPDAQGNPPLSQFALDKEIKDRLLERGVTHLFPIQAKTFDVVLKGENLIGRARTGTGKTLAFVLPVVQRLFFGANAPKAPPKPGRAPRVLCVLPTRELALQVHNEFVSVCPNLASHCVYGGVGYGDQENALRRGLDVIVGTVGRLKDHIERGRLKLNQVEVLILDEADQMLDKGFADDVDFIVDQMPKQADSADPRPQAQVLLFSATLPEWVDGVAQKCMGKKRTVVDLVGTQKLQAATTIRHLLLPIHWSEVKNVLGDLVRCYIGNKGSCIIFAQTKNEATELAVSSTISSECQVLHGDIAQGQRETTLRAFRDGKFRVLVATDVAARGLDITGVDLVIQTSPPENPETYVHRAGRTGRAGKSGVCLTCVTPTKMFFAQNIERRANMKFERITVPQPIDIINTTIIESVNLIDNVAEEVKPYFRKAAEDLLKKKDPVELLTCALAIISGNADAPKSRSLLSGSSDKVTVMIRSRVSIHSLSLVWGQIRRFLYVSDAQSGPGSGDVADNKVSGLRIAQDSRSAVFDIPAEDQELVTEAAQRMKDARSVCEIMICKDLPPLVERQSERPPTPKWREAKGYGRGGRGGHARSSSAGGYSRSSSHGGGHSRNGSSFRGGRSRY